VAEDLEESVKESIKAEGAEVIVVQGDFETAVRESWLHSVSTDGVLVNIDAEENYEDIPRVSDFHNPTPSGDSGQGAKILMAGSGLLKDTEQSSKK